MGELIEEMCLAQLFLQSASSYACVSELGERGLVEFRDLNPHVSAFQRRFVGELRRCEEMEKTFTFLAQKVQKAGRSLKPPEEALPAPLAREALRIQEQSETLSQELREVSHNCEALLAQLQELREHIQVLQEGQRFTGQLVSNLFLFLVLIDFSDSPANLGTWREKRELFVAGVIHPWRVNSFERLLWRACRGYLVPHFTEMTEPIENPSTVRWNTVRGTGLVGWKCQRGSQIHLTTVLLTTAVIHLRPCHTAQRMQNVCKKDTADEKNVP
uniref:V-type proton ATPase subunit a n=1 Tax=Laticauda laticaudata TaxID=8630 RepID=A0A8C5WSF4_LATLA